MARTARKNIDGKYYHVMVQGIGKEFVFPDDNCKGFYIACLNEIKKTIPAKVLAFCVMDNHAHILVTVENIYMLSGYFRKVNAKYAMYYNRIKKRVGYVFRDRYKSENIAEEKYLLNCVMYIQNNPVKAGIVENIKDYRFSSYTNYISGNGTVDFDEAKKYYNISPKNMSVMMQESIGNWMEHDDNNYEDKENVLQELIKNYQITGKIDNMELVAKIAKEIQSRCGISLREIAKLLEVSRESLRRAVSTPPSP